MWFAIVRHFTPNLLRQDRRVRGVTIKLLRAALTDRYLRSLSAAWVLEGTCNCPTPPAGTGAFSG